MPGREGVGRIGTGRNHRSGWREEGPMERIPLMQNTVRA